MAAAKKDTIYIDVDDEITAIIEKVRDSSGKVVALVLPKRATVFQSVVNMKLLKRTAAEAQKHIVLVTSEASLLPLAGAVGLHVAKTAQSKPIIPNAPVSNDMPIDADNPNPSSEEPEIDPNTPIGDLAGSEPEGDSEDTIEVGDDDMSDATDVPAEAAAKDKKGKKSKDKRLKVPDFNKFRIWLFVGIFAIILIGVGSVFAFWVLPKVKVIVKTNNVSVQSNTAISASSATKTVDLQKMLVPSEVKQYKKTDTQKVAATGQKDVGERAKGTATLTLTDCSQDKVTVPQGTALSSQAGTFVTLDSVTLLSTVKGGICKNDSDATGSVAVVAQESGDKYNLSTRAYSVSGFSNVSAAGSAMTGGTSKIITIVAQGDIDGAKQKILDANNAASNQTVAGQLSAEGYIPLPETFVAGEPLVTATPNVGDEASDVTVNVAVTYSMTGVQQSGVKQILEADITKQIDPETQKILDNGLGKAAIHITSKGANGSVAFTVQSTALAGVQQDVGEIKQVVKGKKKGEIQAMLLARPGVKEVNVEFNPFWVFKAPRSADRITVVFEQSDGSTTSGQ